ncbi:MAG TPA: hypothetical protein VJR47_09380 [Stellaceae bacterium]|nr:hypothetical protein [Stellaceae bacterium]
MERSNRRQAWYVARHLKLLSGNLAAMGFAEAALLVGAAAISVGEEAVRPGGQAQFEPSAAEPKSLARGGGRG